MLTSLEQALWALEESATVDAMSAEIVATGRVFRPQLQMQRKDGSRFWGSLRLTTYEVQVCLPLVNGLAAAPCAPASAAALPRAAGGCSSSTTTSWCCEASGARCRASTRPCWPTVARRGCASWRTNELLGKPMRRAELLEAIAKRLG